MESMGKRWNCFPTLPTDLGNRLTAIPTFPPPRRPRDEYFPNLQCPRGGPKQTAEMGQTSLPKAGIRDLCQLTHYEFSTSANRQLTHRTVLTKDFPDFWEADYGRTGSDPGGFRISQITYSGQSRLRFGVSTQLGRGLGPLS